MLKAMQKVRERLALIQIPGPVGEEIARMVEGSPYQESLRGWLLEPNSLVSSYNRAEGRDVAMHSMKLAAAIRRRFSNPPHQTHVVGAKQAETPEAVTLVRQAGLELRGES